MKDMEIKTENRYEYRKTQEKRKQMIAPDLFEFAYVPDWYGHLAELERLALPESWRFRKPSRETKNTETPILERYIHGLNVHAVIFDELHAQPNRELFDVMTKGSGDARTQPLYFLITTAGTDRNSICFEQHQKAVDIIEGRKIDPTFYPVIYGASDPLLV